MSGNIGWAIFVIDNFWPPYVRADAVTRQHKDITVQTPVNSVVFSPFFIHAFELII
jgi:hypothetical protein